MTATSHAQKSSKFTVLIHVFCQHLWISLGLIQRHRFLLLVCCVVLHYIVALLPLGHTTWFLLNLFGFDIFCTHHWVSAFTHHQTLIFFLKTDSIGLLLTGFRDWVIFIFGCTSDKSFIESIFIQCSILMLFSTMISLFFINHALAHASEMRFDVLLIQLYNFVYQASIIFQG